MNVSPLSKIQLKLIKLGCFGKFCTYKCNAVRQAPKGELTLRSSMAVYFCVVTKISKVCQFNENVPQFEVLILSLLSMDEIQTWKIMLKVYLLSGLDEGLLF